MSKKLPPERIAEIQAIADKTNLNWLPRPPEVDAMWEHRLELLDHIEALEAELKTDRATLDDYAVALGATERALAESNAECERLRAALHDLQTHMREVHGDPG